MKALVGAFNQEKALVGAFSVIVQPVVEPMDRFAALVTMDRGPHTRAALRHHYLVTSTHNTDHNTTPCTTCATDATQLSFRDEILLTSCIATPPLEYNLHDTRFWVLAAHRFVSSVTTETRAGLRLLGRALIRFKFVSLGPRKLGFMTPESGRAL